MACISFLFDVFLEVAKILAFILVDTVNDGKKVSSMVAESFENLQGSFASANPLEIFVIALLFVGGAYFAIKFATGNMKTIISVFLIIVLIFFILMILV